MSRRRLGRTVAVASLAAALLGGLDAGTAPPAHASSVSCYGDYCSGKDPTATGCAAGAVTVASANVGAGELDLRWSPTCKTNWARLYVFPTKTLGPGFIYALQPSTGYQQFADVYAIASRRAQSPTYVTPMIYSPVRCVSANFNYDPGYTYNIQSTRCV